MKLQSISRRKFLAGAAVMSGAAAGKGYALPATQTVRQAIPPDPNRKLKFGMVGIGARNREHIERLTHRPDAAEIIALCDIRESALESGKKLCRGTPALYTDYKKMLTHPGLDAIVITTPHFLHAPMAIDAFNAGYDVLVEKPMAISVAECNAMNNAARMNNRILMVTEQHRWQGNNVKIKELLDAGAIGEVQMVWAASFRGSWSPVKRWLSVFAESGGLLLSESSHDLDSFYWFFSSHIARASAMGGTSFYSDYTTLDHILVLYEYENGVKMSFSFSTTAPGHSWQKQRIIFGTKGRLEYDRKGHIIYQYSYPDGKFRKVEEVVEHNVSGAMTAESGHIGTDGMYDHALQCLRKREEPLTSGEVMTESVRVCIAGQDAARTGKVINVREMT